MKKSKQFPRINIVERNPSVSHEATQWQTLWELVGISNEFEFSDRMEKNNIAMCIMLIVVGGTV